MGKPEKDLLAKFKAKYGISYRAASKLLSTDIDSIRQWIKTDSAPKEVNDKIRNYERLAQHLIGEGEVFGGQVSYIQVLEHDKALLSDKVQSLEKDINLVTNMGLWDRLRFLLGTLRLSYEQQGS